MICAQACSDLSLNVGGRTSEYSESVGFNKWWRFGCIKELRGGREYFRLLFLLNLCSIVTHFRILAMYVSNRYCNFVAKWLDEISFLLMSPWLTIFSHFLSCYISTIFEKQHPQRKLIDYFMFGPVYAVLLLLVLPFGVSGMIIWIALCAITNQEKYTYLCVRGHSIVNDKNSELNSGTYTFASINVLLAPEAIARLNNNKDSYARTSKIAERILNHTGKQLCNLISQDDFEMKSKYNSVLAEFPCLDFLCLQEVWERAYALVLIEHLKNEFSYFLYDIGDYSFSNNFCMLGECFKATWFVLCQISFIKMCQNT